MPLGTIRWESVDGAGEAVGGKCPWRPVDLVGFVGARDTAAKLTTDLVRNGNGTGGFFADDAAAAAALRAAGCPEVAPRLLPDGDAREP